MALKSDPHFPHRDGDHEPPAPRPRFWQGLSGKVLLLVVLFLMIGEVMIFLPSVANFRVTWLKNKIAMAEVAALALEAAPDRTVSDELRRELLQGAGVKVVALKRGSSRHLVLRDDDELMIDASYDLRRPYTFASVGQALYTLVAGGDRIIGAVDKPPNMSGEFIEIALEEAPLRAAMLTYSVNILWLSIILSLIVATFVFIALNQVLVRPIRRLTINMLKFARNPEDARRIITPSNRSDEIGIAERQLQHMQSDLSQTLQQKNRLAALGLAVSKISHDLRNMLASAQLVSDRLSSVDDPTVKKFAPKLLDSLDRAIMFCAQTLKFGRAQETPPQREEQPLRPIVDDVVDSIAAGAVPLIVFYNEVDDDLRVDADRDQLFRILMNLVRNSAEVLEGELQRANLKDEGAVRISGRRSGRSTAITVRDNGPGVPQRARAHLFEAFKSAARSGGTGLGLTIAQELAHAHGGMVRLIEEDGPGAAFEIVIPDRDEEAARGRRGKREDVTL